MDGEFLLAALMRWLHILAAIAAVGGAIFMRLCLMPAANTTLAPEVHQDLRSALMRRWSKVVMVCILFLLVSGFYTFLVRVVGGNLELPKYYHPLFGIKFLLALAIFFIASALAGRSSAFDKLRQNAKFWLTLNITFAVILVCISGILRTARDAAPPKVGDAEAKVSAAPEG